MTQAKGALSRLLLDYETTFGSDPASPNGRSLPFNTCGLEGSQAKNSPATITGTRNPVAPFAGNVDAAGSIVVPVDSTAFFYWLRLMFGAPADITATSEQSLDAAAAVNVGGGVVGIPCTGHGYSTGDAIRLIGTTNYDGTYTVLASSGTDQIDITATSAAETFSAADVVGEPPYAFKFTVPDSQPSAVIEKGFTDLDLHWKYNGCKISRMSISVGGDGELTATLETLAMKENEPSATEYDATPTTVTLARLNNFQAAVKEGEVTSSEVTALDISIDFGLDGDQRVIGGNGMRGAIPEGILKVEINFTALYQDNALVTKGANNTETSIRLTITSGTNILDLFFPEGEFERFKAPIDGPGGVRQTSKFIAFYANHADASVAVVTLTNSQSYSGLE
jgi:hypothetical protein